jgi:hypothetical protein
MMDMLLAVALMVLTLTMAGYAQYRLRFHSATPRQALFTRLVLILVGLGFGWTAMVWTLEPDPWSNAITFLTAFGLVHVPAAVILYIKRRRGVYR